MTKTLLLIVVTGSVGGDGGVTGQCHQICQHHDNVPSLTTSAAPPVIKHKAGRYWALELAWQRTFAKFHSVQRRPLLGPFSLLDVTLECGRKDHN